MPFIDPPPFRPHPLFRGGHAQTLAGVYLPGKLPPYTARQHLVTLDDGDQLVLHDDTPVAGPPGQLPKSIEAAGLSEAVNKPIARAPIWQAGDPAALLIHGLSGCHASPYMRRIASKLVARGVRVFRLDLRGCGAGRMLARLPYHAGRSEDARAAIETIASLCPSSPIAAVGFSLGGNILLKLLGELASHELPMLRRAMAVCPPVDLAACTHNLQQSWARIYDSHFSRTLVKQLRAVQAERNDPAAERYLQRPRRLLQFDDTYTAPVCGFGNAETYYRACSASGFIPRIERPTLILAAADDPLVPIAGVLGVDRPPCVRLIVSSQGGHLGFLARDRAEGDRRWMDWRVVDWLTAME